ncbi:MAG: hypothetical protein HQ523_03985 [Lentisphaerae bacterium]|nr:hypothetical protein [Lentisphaerota bacterium]
MQRRWNELAGLFVAGFTTLLFEITLTRIFEFTVWSNYAYLIISIAILGIGFSGILLMRWPKLLQINATTFLTISAAACGITMFTGLLLINRIPIHLPNAPDGWGQETMNLLKVFVVLATPFTFFGLIVTYLLDNRGEKANVYYFADLVGAGLGSLALVFLIQKYHPQGIVALCAVLTLVAALLFLLGEAPRSKAKWVVFGAGSIAALLALLLWIPNVKDQIPLTVHVAKRTFVYDEAAGNIEHTGWSALSRVDIAAMDPDRKRVWIAGGVNESSICRFDGDYEAMRATRPILIPAATQILDYKILPHLSKTNHTVCMIGTSGGEDSLYALMAGARKVIGVEMDPTIARFVTETYKDYAGGLFTDGDYSELVVDEGRSYLRRTDRKFDVIQQVNNFTPIAFQNGALNLSETYLLTVESFKSFYDKLTDDGILCISRYGSIRLLSIAVEMFRRMGMEPEEYAKHLVVCEGPQWVINSFMLKKSAFTEAEIDTLYAFFEGGSHNRQILYAPYRTQKLPDLEKNLYYKIATAADPSEFYRVGCFDFSPTTDNKPFFNRMKVLGAKDVEREKLTLLPPEILHIEHEGRFHRRVPQGDVPPLMVLFGGAIMATVFFGVPIFSTRRLRHALKGRARTVGYFACLGLGFMFVEICLIQRLVLFLGAPVYSIAAVICSLLVSSGLGSLFSGRIAPKFTNIRNLLLAVAGSVLILNFLIDPVTQMFLGSALPLRVIIALLLTGGAGFLMGMPMPSGIRYLKSLDSPLIPWAWAVNGYFTVIATALSVIIAMTFGFTTVFLVATVIYAIAPFFLPRD